MKRVVNVGQCNPDHAAICGLLQRQFNVQVVRTHELRDTLAELRNHPCDLILINRKLDVDNSEGMAILKVLKADPQLASIPAMVITNYEEFQQAAISAGAVLGFGKSELHAPSTLERLSPFLRDREETSPWP